MIEPITRFESALVALPMANIDTDQIIPARFLKVTDRSGLGDALFADWRYDATGSMNPDFALNRPSARGAGILVAGDNFGCGSSREHAPWALRAFGIRAVISTSFADIFRNNALGNGLLPVQVDETILQRLFAICAGEATPHATVDLELCELTFGDRETVSFPVEAFARHCLIHGVDRLGFLLSCANDIASFEAQHATTAGVTT